MYKIGKGLGLLLFIVIIGAMVGGLIGEIIGVVVPEGKIRQIFLSLDKGLILLSFHWVM